ncbi:MAG: glycosyltransferase family 1 protein, partial [Dehalococcoidia bacterium]
AGRRITHSRVVSDTKLRLALDVAPVRAQPAGVGLYVALLARELAARIPESLALIGIRREAAGLDDIGPVARLPFRSPSYHSWLQLHADRDARRWGATLAHYTNAAAPLRSRRPYVLTVHDLSLLRMPGTHPMSRRVIVPINLWSIARAKVIIAPSDWTAHELRRLGVSARRVVVIPHAPTLPATAAAAGGETSTIVERFGLEQGRYVLYAGTLEPRKNLVRLVDAFERLAREQPGLQLVLAGAPGWHYGGIARHIENSAVRNHIVLPGYLAPVDLAALIEHSGVVAYVSLYEGFGMPVLDAMALGAAVVTSDLTAMPEAAGGAGVLVDPLDVGGIARGLADGLSRREELSRGGRERAAGWTWADVAAEHLAIYRIASR